jgi:hypothetical protein
MPYALVINIFVKPNYIQEWMQSIMLDSWEDYLKNHEVKAHKA